MKDMKKRIATGSMRQAGRILAAVLTMILMLTVQIAVSAEVRVSEMLDPGKTCSLTLYKLVENGTNGAVSEGTGLAEEQGRSGLGGVVFSVLRIADLSSYILSNKDGAVTHGVYYTGVSEAFAALYQRAVGQTLSDRAVPGADETGYTAEVLEQAVAAICKSAGDGRTWTGETALTDLACTGRSTAPTDADGRVRVEELSQGLYLIGENLSSYSAVEEGRALAGPCTPFLAALPMTSRGAIGSAEPGSLWQYDVTVYPKNSVMAVSKFIISENDGKTLKNAEHAEIGEAFTQIITGTAPIQAVASGERTDRDYVRYVLRDEMSESLYFDEVTEVRIGAEVRTPQTTDAFAGFYVLREGDYAVTAGPDRHRFSVELTGSGLDRLNALELDAEIVVFFRSHLNAAAVIAGDGSGQNMNRPSISWRNRNGLEQELEGLPVRFYTYGLELMKTGLPSAAEAVFEVERKNGEEIEFIKEAEGFYHVAASDETARTTKLSPASSGLLKIRGLDEDGYVMQETATGSGYGLLRSPFELVLTSNQPIDGCLLKAEVETEGKRAGLVIKHEGTSGIAQLTVANYGQIRLKTGGSGSRGFYIAGAGLAVLILLLGAVFSRRGRKRV